MEEFKFENNPEFQEVFHSKIHDVRFYMPNDIANKYHISRYAAAGAQDIFSGAGATKGFLREMANQIKEWCNNASIKELRTNVGTFMDNLLYRLQYPIDEHCSLRMGAIFVFMDGENPDDVKDFWTQRKVEMAIGDIERKLKPDPDLYTFFLSLGVEFTPSYKTLSDTLSDIKYFQNRRMMLEGLTPPPFRTE